MPNIAWISIGSFDKRIGSGHEPKLHDATLNLTSIPPRRRVIGKRASHGRLLTHWPDQGWCNDRAGSAGSGIWPPAEDEAGISSPAWGQPRCRDGRIRRPRGSSTTPPPCTAAHIADSDLLLNHGITSHVKIPYINVSGRAVTGRALRISDDSERAPRLSFDRAWTKAPIKTELPVQRTYFHKDIQREEKSASTRRVWTRRRDQMNFSAKYISSIWDYDYQYVGNYLPLPATRFYK